MNSPKPLFLGYTSTMHAGEQATPDSIDARIVDVPLRAPLTRRFAILCGMSGIALIMLLLSSLMAYRLGTVYATATAAVVVFVAVLGCSRAVRRITEKRVNRYMVSIPSLGLAESVERIVDTTRTWHPMAAMREMTQALAIHGYVNTAVRIGPDTALTDTKPLLMPFEPQALDETEPSFRQLWASADAAGASDADTSEDDLTLRRVKRNVALKGGWILGAVLGFTAAFELAFLIFWNVSTYRTVLYPALFLMYLFAPAQTSAARKKQLFAVPGGIVTRKAERNGWRVHLFTRESSVLCLYRTGRRQWTVVIADAEQAEAAHGTQTEVTFALRAWLSPLDPPSPDRLSDLA